MLNENTKNKQLKGITIDYYKHYCIIMLLKEHYKCSNGDIYETEKKRNN